MANQNRWLLLFCFFLTGFQSQSQNPVFKDYIIITYEQKFTRGFEGIKRTFWITPVDSIFSTGTKFFPLLLSGYFKNDTDSCCSGKEIDPYLSTPTKDNDLDSARANALSTLQTIIFTNRKKIQTILKKWDLNNQEHITIYATPVAGAFCSSKFSFTGRKRSEYSDLVCIPYAQIVPDSGFWNTVKSKLIMRFDFSKYNFNHNILYNVFPEWRKYGK